MSTQYSPLFEKAALRLTQARTVDSLKRSLRNTRCLWMRVDRLLLRGELGLDKDTAASLRRQADYVVQTLESKPVLNDGEIEQVIEINRQARETLAPRRGHRQTAAE